MENEQLLTQGKIFEDEILAGAKSTAKPAEDVPEPHDHGKNLTGPLPIKLSAKLLILWVCDVLMNDSPLSAGQIPLGEIERKTGKGQLGMGEQLL